MENTKVMLDVLKEARNWGAEIDFSQVVTDNKQHHFWYGGEVAEIKYKGNVFLIEAIGDVRLSLIENNKEVAYVKDKNNQGNFYHVMNSHVKDDKELEKLLEEHYSFSDRTDGKYLDIENNNWWECFIIDENGKHHDLMWNLESSNFKEAVVEVLFQMKEMLKYIN